MKNQVIAIIVSILLISLIFELPQLADANPTSPNPMSPYIIFNSPTNNSYHNGIGFVTLDISVGTITLGQCPGESYELTYSLDGQKFKSLSLTYNGIFSDNSMPHSLYTGQISLPALSEGNHTIAAHCIFKIDKYTLTSDNKVIFNIDKTPPKVRVLTLENKTYETPDLPLNLTVNEFCYPSYDLDGKYITIEGNSTLEGLTSGSHCITVYAQDIAGNSDSQTIFFSVRENEPFTIITVAIFIAIVALVSVGLAIHFRKKGRLSTEQCFSRVDVTQ